MTPGLLAALLIVGACAVGMIVAGVVLGVAERRRDRISPIIRARIARRVRRLDDVGTALDTMTRHGEAAQDATDQLRGVVERLTTRGAL